MIVVVGLIYELAERASGSRAYRAGVAVALVASVLTVWTTLVRDDGTGVSFFLLIMAAVVGGFSAWFRPAGMARDYAWRCDHAGMAQHSHCDRAFDRERAGWLVQGFIVWRFLRSAVANVGNVFSRRSERGSQGGCGALGIGGCALCEPNATLFAMLG